MNKQPIQQKDSMEQVIKFYSGMVYRLALARTGTVYDADEVYQEVFLRYIRKNPEFKSEEHRKAWLIRVTVNCSKSLLSSAWRKKTQALDDSIMAPGIIFEEKEDRQLYYELQQLPPKYREVIHLFYYEDMPVKEISRVLHRSSSTIRAQLTRARAMLKHIIKEEEDDFS